VVHPTIFNRPSKGDPPPVHTEATLPLEPAGPLDRDAASRVALVTFDRLLLAVAARDRWAIRRHHITLRSIGLDVVVIRPVAQPAEAAKAFADLVWALATKDFTAAQMARKRLAGLNVLVAPLTPKTEGGA
jgi:hypothetical protein